MITQEKKLVERLFWHQNIYISKTENRLIFRFLTSESQVHKCRKSEKIELPYRDRSKRVTNELVLGTDFCINNN